MKALILAVVLLFASVFAKKDGGKNWAVLIAGSNGWSNYRHQSDICHAYQMLHANGIPDERIIVFMYDDIAENSRNPKKGYIRNVLGGGNVYENVLIDYKGKEVNKANFFKVLRGEDMSGIGSGKTLKSGPNDHVLLVFDDHGGTGILGMPDSNYIHAQELLDVMADMREMYDTMAFYLNACHSGSMFDGILPTNTSIIALTAANPTESGYAVDYDDEIRAYLSSDFAKNWVVDTENAVADGTIAKKTFYQQYVDVAEITHKRSPRQHVCWYGDESLANTTVKTWHTEDGKFNTRRSQKVDENARGVSNGDMELHFVYKQLAENPHDEELTEQLNVLLGQKERAQKFWTKFNGQFNLERRSVSNDDDGCRRKNDSINSVCQMHIIESYRKHCGNFNDFDLYDGTYALHKFCQSERSLKISEDFFQAHC